MKEATARITDGERFAHAALLDCAYSFSPRVESTAQDTVIADLTGTERLLGVSQAIGRQMADRCCASGFDVNIGIATNPDTALCAARGLAGTTVIPSGEEGKRLGSLPIKVLQPAPETLDVLDAWGICDFKSFAALPSVPLTQRLGQYGLHLQLLAQGAVRRELVPAEQAPSFLESTDLEEAVALLEPLSFVLNRLLEQLMERLRARSLATDHVELELLLEIHSDRDVRTMLSADPVTALHRCTVKLPVPTQDAKVLLKLMQLDLAAHSPQAPVKKIKIEAVPARIRPTQAGLFQPLAPEPAKLEITLARLRGVVASGPFCYSALIFSDLSVNNSRQSWIEMARAAFWQRTAHNMTLFESN
jgi:protein ImuB